MIETPIKQKVYDFSQVYDSCNAAQKEAVDCTEGSIMVVAGPGTGKTQIIAARIANIINGGTSPDNILCLTYTDAGTIAMRERLLAFIGTEAYRVNIFTFHAFCNSVIQENSSQFGFNELRPVSDLEKTEVVQCLLDELPHDNPLARDKGDLYSDARALLNLFAAIKRENWNIDNCVQAIDQYIAALPTLPEMKYTRKYKEFKAGDLKQHAIDAETKKFERSKAAFISFNDFQRLMKERSRYDFDDMIIWVIRAFKENSQLLLEYQERYQYLLVDEYQDTSGSQNEVVDLLMGYWDDPNLFIVGDDDQSIYRFQGANINNILSFNDKYVPATVVLTENYRSTQQILDAAMAFISSNRERLVNESDDNSLKITKNLTAAKMADGGRPQVWAFPNITQESLGIALKLEERFGRGDDLSKIAVLYKNHKQAATIIRYLRAKGIPFCTRRREDVLTTPIVVQLLLVLNYLHGELQKPHSQERALFLMLQHPSLGFSPLEVARLFLEDDRPSGRRTPLRERLAGSSCASVAGLIEKSLAEHGVFALQEYVHRVLTGFGMLTYISGTDDAVWQMTALATFFNFVRDECAKAPQMQLGDLIKSLETMQSRKLQLTADRIEFDRRGVNFITCHSSKGLEFESVFIVGCIESEWEKKQSRTDFALPPSIIAGHDSGCDVQLEEMRRLFYVAMTRAEKELVVSYARNTDGDKPLARSLFVAELEKTALIDSKELQLEPQELADAMPAILLEEPPDMDDLFNSDLIGEWLKHYKLSVSHLNTYLKCPRTFFFENLLHIPQVKNAAMAFGTSAHVALEYAFKAMQKSPELLFPSVDDFIARFEKEMHRHQDAFEATAFQRRLKNGGDNLRKFYELNSPAWGKKVLLEESFQSLLDGEIPLNGLVDRLDIFGQKVTLIDYKTGRYDRNKLLPPNPDKVEKTLADKKDPKHEDLHGGDYWRQAVFYKLLVENSPKYQYQIESMEFCFVEPDEKSGEFKHHPIEITAADEAIVRGQIYDVYNKIMKREFSGKCTNKYCSWCV